MTRQQFMVRHHEAIRAGRWTDVPALVVLIGGLILVGPVVRHLCTCYPPLRIYCAATVTVLGFLGVNYLLARWERARRMQAAGLICPDCGMPLRGGRHSVVLATGRCRYCQSMVVPAVGPAVA